MCKKSILLFFLIVFFARANAQKTYVFIGSYNAGKNTPGIYLYELDTASGKLSELSVVRDIKNPSFLSVSPNGKFVVACTDTKTPGGGSVTSFQFDITGEKLTFINTERSGGENPVYVSFDSTGQWLINANYTGGSASIFRINNEGEISPALQVIPYTDRSIHKERQEHSHIHSAVFSPDNKYVFFPDLGADKIRIYGFDGLKKQPFQNASIHLLKHFPAAGQGISFLIKKEQSRIALKKWAALFPFIILRKEF